MRCRTRLASEPFSAEAELSSFMAELDGEGAVVSFVGVARPASKAGGTVERLVLEHYPGMTEKSLAAIGRDGAARFDISAVSVVHRCGEIGAGEPIVFVATASLHRREAFLAADYLMDRLKTEAVFWKREEGVDGSRWIEPTDADRADAARWED